MTLTKEQQKNLATEIVANALIHEALTTRVHNALSICDEPETTWHETGYDCIDPLTTILGFKFDNDDWDSFSLVMDIFSDAIYRSEPKFNITLLKSKKEFSDIAGHIVDSIMSLEIEANPFYTPKENTPTSPVADLTIVSNTVNKVAYA